MSPSATTLMQSLVHRQMKLVRVSSTHLRISALAGALTDEDRAELRARKDELLELLGPQPCASCGRFAFDNAGVVCYWCRHPGLRA